MTQLRRLNYTSLARAGLLLSDMDAILKAAQRFNTRHDVTGALFFNGVGFMQVLEGAAENVAAVYHRVQADPRHGRVEIMRDETISERAFPDWSMNLFYVPPSGEVLDMWGERLEPYFNRLPTSVPPELRRQISAFEAVSC